MMKNELDNETQQLLAEYQKRLQSSARLYQDVAVRLAEARMRQEILGPRQEKTGPKDIEHRRRIGMRETLGTWVLNKLFPADFSVHQERPTSKRVVIDGGFKEQVTEEEELS